METSAMTVGNQEGAFGDRVVVATQIGCLQLPGCRANSVRQFELLTLI